jgi:anaerobic magnesium-protoporphyrin IX monomethyl ester cyclase
VRKVLLVYPYFYTGVTKDPLFPPLGIGMLSTCLKQKDIDVMKLDCTFLTMDEAIQKASVYKPDITGIYVMATLVMNAVRILDRLQKVNPDSIYVAGGPMPTLYPKRFAEKFDYVFKGEAISSFPDFCREYLDAPDRSEFMKNSEALNYPGLFSLSPCQVDIPAMHLTREATYACPLPDRDGFDHEKYQKMSFACSGYKKASIMTTYGCPFSCNFCSKPIFGNDVRFRSLDHVIQEIRDILSYGYDALWIADDLFTFSAEFLKNFCARLIEENLPVTWSCLSRVDTITDEIALLMKKAGCHKVYLGIESGNDEVLQLMNKKTTTAEVKSGVQKFKGSGIECAGFFIVGYPGETVATIEETFAFAMSLELDEISFNVPYPLPGSKLYQSVSGISNDDWTIENEVRFLYQCDFDEGWLKKRIQDTMNAFALRKSAG